MVDEFEKGLIRPLTSKYIPVVTPSGKRIHLWLPPTDFDRKQLNQGETRNGMTLCGLNTTLLAAIRYAEPTEPKCRTCSTVLRGTQRRG